MWALQPFFIFYFSYCPSHEAPYKGALFEQNAHLQFKYKLVVFG